MLTGHPNPPLGRPEPHNLDILPRPLQPDLEIAITPEPGQRIRSPRRRERRGRRAGGVRGGVVRQERDVGREEVGERGRGAGEVCGDVGCAGVEDVEEEGWLGAGLREGGEGEALLGPGVGVLGAGVGWGEEVREAGVVGCGGGGGGGGGGGVLVEGGCGCGCVWGGVAV